MIGRPVEAPSEGTARSDDRRDVIVQHVTRADPAGAALDRWLVFAGDERRGDLDDAPRAIVFARLLADLRQGRVWIRHDDSGDLQQVDAGSIRGCSCC